MDPTTAMPAKPGKPKPPGEFPMAYKSANDDFFLYKYKIDPCPQKVAHNWTTCPFSHPGEKARRRDPRKYNYIPQVCAFLRQFGVCHDGDACPYAHNVFECRMHPTRFKKELCKEGSSCNRPVCFFAHSVDDLRISSGDLLHPHTFPPQQIITGQQPHSTQYTGGGGGGGGGGGAANHHHHHHGSNTLAAPAAVPSSHGLYDHHHGLFPSGGLGFPHQGQTTLGGGGVYSTSPGMGNNAYPYPRHPSSFPGFAAGGGGSRQQGGHVGESHLGRNSHGPGMNVGGRHHHHHLPHAHLRETSGGMGSTHPHLLPFAGNTAGVSSSSSSTTTAAFSGGQQQQQHHPLGVDSHHHRRGGSGGGMIPYDVLPPSSLAMGGRSTTSPDYSADGASNHSNLFPLEQQQQRIRHDHHDHDHDHDQQHPLLLQHHQQLMSSSVQMSSPIWIMDQQQQSSSSSPVPYPPRGGTGVHHHVPSSSYAAHIHPLHHQRGGGGGGPISSRAVMSSPALVTQLATGEEGEGGGSHQHRQIYTPDDHQHHHHLLSVQQQQQQARRRAGDLAPHLPPPQHKKEGSEDTVSYPGVGGGGKGFSSLDGVAGLGSESAPLALKKPSGPGPFSSVGGGGGGGGGGETAVMGIRNVRTIPLADPRTTEITPR